MIDFISKSRRWRACALPVGLLLGLVATSGMAETVRTPIAVKFESREDYPPGAVDRGEEGTAIVAIMSDSGSLTAKLLQSSGFDDLDRASMALAVPYFQSGAMNGVNLLAVDWSLKERARTISERFPIRGRTIV